MPVSLGLTTTTYVAGTGQFDDADMELNDDRVWKVSGTTTAIDVESGAYELDPDELEACDKLNARIPDAQTWLVRVGSRYVHRRGAGKELDVS